MGHALDDLFGHNAWATSQVIAACGELDDALLDATVPGTYGTIIETLRHLIDSEMSYLFRVSGLWPERPWQTGEPVALDVVAERANVLARTWETYLNGGVDPDALGEARGDDGSVFAVRGGVFLTQALHHANEHRAHICTILGANGIEPPDVSAWGYGLATGRFTVTSGPSSA